MNPWKTLNIEPTDDKKAIKKAYAVLIKQYNPDEFPEKFKEIQEAYKLALSMRQWQIEEPENKPLIQKTKEGVGDFEAESFELSEVHIDKEQLKFEQQQQNLIENIFKKMHEMAFAPLAVKNKIENWKFIDDFYQIDDISLKHDVAINVFSKLAEYNLFQLQSNGTLLMNKNIIHYFNQVFDWSSQWEIYQSIFPPNVYAVNFQFIDVVENKGVKQKSLLSLRFGAFLTDILFIVFIVITMRLIQFGLGIAWFEGSVASYIFLPMVFVIRLLFEIMSKNKRSLGKASNNLIIVNEFGNFCSTQQVLLRNLVLVLEILLIIFAPMVIEQGIDSAMIILIAIYTLIFVNLGLYFFTKKMLHDYFSKTQILKQLITK